MHARGVGGNQGEADAQVFFVTQQVVGVIRLEGQAQERGHRAEGDVALFPVQAQAQCFLAFPFTLADDAGVGHRPGVGAGQWPGQGEAGNIVATGQSRQVMVALFVGAVVQQQFRRAEGVGDHHGGSQVAAARGQFHRHLGVGIGGEPLAAVFLGNDQCEEPVLLDMGPGFRRQVHGLADLPVADHCAEGFGGAVEERLLLLGQLHLGVGQQQVPIRAAAEQFAVPPHRAGVDGVALGLGHGRQGFLEPVEHRRTEIPTAQVR